MEPVQRLQKGDNGTYYTLPLVTNSTKEVQRARKIPLDSRVMRLDELVTRHTAQYSTRTPVTLHYDNNLN